jgi:hypothetical protein
MTGNPLGPGGCLIAAVTPGFGDLVALTSLLTVLTCAPCSARSVAHFPGFQVNSAPPFAAVSA